MDHEVERAELGAHRISERLQVLVLRYVAGQDQRIAQLLPEKTKWKLFLASQARRTQYLAPGDVVEARIRSTDGRLDLGVQRNRIVAEA